jgi:hypothetical protein
VILIRVIDATPVENPFLRAASRGVVEMRASS